MCVSFFFIQLGVDYLQTESNLLIMTFSRTVGIVVLAGIAFIVLGAQAFSHEDAETQAYASAIQKLEEQEEYVGPGQENSQNVLEYLDEFSGGSFPRK